MDLLGLDYQIIPSDFDEKLIRHENPRILAERLSEAKALSVAKKHTDAVIIASDAVVHSNREIFEKPHNQRDAFRMLKNLSGRNAEFITGLVVYNSKTGAKLSTVKSCEIKFRPLLDKEITKYIDEFPATNCAGAFEHHGLLLFSEYVNGSYNFRTAIPVDELILFLRKQGIPV